MNSISQRPILVIKVLAQALFLYGTLTWLYGILIQVTHPEWVPLPLSYLTLWLRLDTFTILSFFASALGFLVWRLIVELMKAEQNKSAH